jgi:hypothetical protein
MKRFAQLCGFAARTLGAWALSFALWTLWLGLALLLAFQLYVATAREVAVPGFVLRALEERLERAGFRAKFGRTAFDLAGRVHVENLALALPAFAEPVLTARAVAVQLDPWLLALGRVEAREVRLGGVAVAVPAMLSPSGRAEEVLRDTAAVFEPGRRSVIVRQLSGHLGGLVLAARGTIAFGALAGATEPRPDPLAEIGRRFPAWCRQALAVTAAIARCDAPALDLEFSPSESGATTAIRVQAIARAVRLPDPLGGEVRDAAVATRLLLLGDAPPSDIAVAAGEARLADGTRAAGVSARILGRVRFDGAQFDLRELRLTADALAAQGVAATALAAQVFPGPLPALEVAAVARVLGAPLAVQAAGDAAERRGTVRFHGEISPAILGVIGARTGADVKRFFDFDSLAIERGEARFAAGGKFEGLTARMALPVVRAYGVTMTDGRVRAELEPGRFRAPEAFARIGESFARGSYEHDLATHRHRFLLAGRLRPLEISAWFRSGWWQRFFEQFDFARAAPEAEVDVQGVWREGRQSRVFVFADAAGPTIRSAALDRVRTRLFIRSGAIDGLELLATRGAGAAAGTFLYTNEPATGEWRTVALNLDSTLELPTVATLVGPAAAGIFRPFQLAQAPIAQVAARFAHAAAPGGAVTQVKIDARAAGEFRFQGFPLQDVSFKAAVDRDRLTVDELRGMFAGGRLSGQVRAWGLGAQRRVGFDLALADASLGPLVTGVSAFFAARRGEPPAPPGKFVQEKAAVHVDLAAAAEGAYDDPLSYRGAGSAVLSGAEIGEVPMLGALSGLLKFTALRFTAARGNFRIEGPRLVFPDLKLRGANSAIDGQGTYALDRGVLDINAKIFPFQESDSLIKTVVGAVLTPLSNAFEVHLTGPLTKPEWAFANFSPTPTPAPTEPAPPAAAPPGNALPPAP